MSFQFYGFSIEFSCVSSNTGFSFRSAIGEGIAEEKCDDIPEGGALNENSWSCSVCCSAAGESTMAGAFSSLSS